ncbi:hypothetical protein VTK73DRAFT_299 [Phialemonium thermophilum]|uniref:Zn(2)-C6 fungal-type domain-containing protein n=1 Tax=Phialemonium thermophilum TaxID=223376 RepID=A0ABR3XFF8_9PEZI
MSEAINAAGPFSLLPQPLRQRGSNIGAPASSPRATGVRGRYASRACQECRRRRVKCDAKRPSCSRCVGRRLSCIYSTDDDNRGTAPKSYVRLLQARVRVLEQILWLHSIDINESAAHLLEQSAFPTSTLRPGNDDVPNSAFDRLCASLDDTTSLNDSLNFEQDGEARHFGPTSGRLDIQKLHDDSDAGRNQLEARRAIDQRTKARPRPLERANHIPKELESHLLDIYFSWEQPWCQVVDEGLFRASKETGGRFYSPLLLNSILSVASRHSDRIEVRSDPEDPETAGRAFLETAETLLPLEMKYPGITTLQALAILGTVYIAMGLDAAGWLHQGMANRLVLDMGLHLDSTAMACSNQMSTEEARLRKQVYWSVYIYDKLSATYTGRICTMPATYGVVKLPAPADLSGVTNDRENFGGISSSLLLSFQYTMCTHAQILETILSNLYAPNQLSRESRRQSFFDSCLVQLKAWYYALPSELNPTKPTTPRAPNTFAHAYILCMLYHTSIIMLTKPFLPAVDPRNHDVLQPLDSFEAIGNEPSRKALSLWFDASDQIASLGELYRNVFGSFRRSPITATHCTLSAALALLHPLSRLRPHQDSIAHSLESCVKTLEELSSSWKPARRYHRRIVKIVQARRRAVDGVIDGSPRDPDGNSDVQHQEQTSELDLISGSGKLPQPCQAVGESDPLDVFNDYSMLDMPFWPELSNEDGPNSLPWDYTSFNSLNSGFNTWNLG